MRYAEEVVASVWTYLYLVCQNSAVTHSSAHAAVNDSREALQRAATLGVPLQRLHCCVRSLRVPSIILLLLIKL